MNINEEEKDPARSENHRNRGNEFFKKKEDDRALDEYNLAVKFGSRKDASLREILIFFASLYTDFIYHKQESKKVE